jgi:hypothetical protein
MLAVSNLLAICREYQVEERFPIAFRGWYFTQAQKISSNFRLTKLYLAHFANYAINTADLEVTWLPNSPYIGRVAFDPIANSWHILHQV